MENTSGSNKKAILIVVVVILVALIIGILVKSGGDDNTSSADNGAEVVNTESSEVINNTSDMEKLKSSEYTSDVFDNIKLGDSVSTVEENIGTLEKLEIDGEYDTYTYTDKELASTYVFYFSNDELKEVSVFLV